MKQTVVQSISNYRILKSHPLGKGACGEVFFGQSNDGMKVAVKNIDINQLTDHIEKQIKSQITTLKSLSSPFIVKMYDCFRSGEHLYIVLEFCQDGDLKSYLDKFRKTNGISEAEALTFMRHLINGYRVLLQKKVIHRDIKPANILLKQGVAKLSDFGFSRVVDDPTKTQKLSCLGTPLYTAPEVLARQEFSNSCDVWSMGIVFYQMLHGRAPWNGSDIENLYSNIKTKPIEFKQTLKSQIKNIISAMLTVERHKRISWQQLMQHPLFAQPINLDIEKSNKKELSYEDVKRHMVDYLRNYLVKSYLLLNTNAAVTFAPNQQELGVPKNNSKLMIESQTNQLTLRRNFAFLHMYVLALYWRNRELKTVPDSLNYYMQFQFGLIGQAFQLIKRIGHDFAVNNKQGSPEWLNYQKTPQYTELSQLLEKDYNLLGLLLQACRKEIYRRLQLKQLHPDTANYLKKYDQNFGKVFKKAMEFNLTNLKQGKKTGASALIADYITNYILDSGNIINNPQLNFASFYEKREKDYGLD